MEQTLSNEAILTNHEPQLRNLRTRLHPDTYYWNRLKQEEVFSLSTRLTPVSSASKSRLKKPDKRQAIWESCERNGAQIRQALWCSVFDAKLFNHVSEQYTSFNSLEDRNHELSLLFEDCLKSFVIFEWCGSSNWFLFSFEPLLS